MEYAGVSPETQQQEVCMSSMSLSLKLFPDGTVLQDLGSIPVTGGGSVTLSAFPTITLSGVTYGFLFWDTEASVSSDASVTFHAPGSDFAADAWYIAEGGGPGGTGVGAYAFSRNEHKVIPGTPIGSVTPAGAWSGPPSTSVSTTTSPNPVQITALAEIAPYGLFLKWLQFGNGTASGSVLTVPSGGASTAIAFFGIPDPDPCQPIRDQLENLSPADFPTLAAYQAALRALAKELLACEKKYGEIS
jgi:hypothetical protein